MDIETTAERIYNKVLSLIANRVESGEAIAVIRNAIKSINPTSAQVVRAIYPDAYSAYLGSATGGPHQILSRPSGPSISSYKPTESEAWDDALIRIKIAVDQYGERYKASPHGHFSFAEAFGLMCQAKVSGSPVQPIFVAAYNDGSFKIFTTNSDTTPHCESPSELRDKLIELANPPRPSKPPTVTIEVPFEWAEKRAADRLDFETGISEKVNAICRKAVEPFR